MAECSAATGRREAGVREPRPGERPTGWGAWLVFAGVMLAVVGLLHAMTGLTALLNDEVLRRPLRAADRERRLHRLGLGAPRCSARSPSWRRSCCSGATWSAGRWPSASPW